MSLSALSIIFPERCREHARYSRRHRQANTTRWAAWNCSNIVATANATDVTVATTHRIVSNYMTACERELECVCVCVCVLCMYVLWEEHASHYVHILVVISCLAGRLCRRCRRHRRREAHAQRFRAIYETVAHLRRATSSSGQPSNERTNMPDKVSENARRGWRCGWRQRETEAAPKQ